jgi:hypothetical protein
MVGRLGAAVVDRDSTPDDRSRNQQPEITLSVDQGWAAGG